MFARSARLPRVRSLSGLLVAMLLAALIGLVLPATHVFAAPILKLTVALAPGTTLPIPSGQPFRLRLTYECSSSLAGDTCVNMVVTSTLPASLEGLQVLGNTDVQLSSYDAPSRTATWTLASPLPLGTTGQLEFEVRFLPGVTVDGTSATVTGTVTAQGATPTTTTLPGVIADAVDQSTVAKVLESGGAVGDVANYRIDVCPGLLGALNLTNVTITDTLPLGALYISSVPPATSVNTSANPHVVVWSGISSVDVPNCGVFRVSATFPAADPSNVVGASKTNNVAVTGTPFGGVVKTMTNSKTHVLASPNPGFALNKTADGDTIVGGLVTTQLNVTNTGNVQVSNVVVSDPIPTEYNVTSIDTGAATAVEYQKNGGATWIAGVPLGSGVAVGSFPGFIAGDYVSGLRFTLGTVAVASSTSVSIYSTVINPPHGGGAAYTLPHYVTNTATLTGEFGGVPLTDKTSGATTEIEVPKARPAPQKATIAGNPALPGRTVRYELKMTNGSFLQLDEPVIADLLPAEVDYTTGSWALTKNITGCAASPTFTITPNFNASGRTLLQWSWAGTGCAIPSGDDAQIEFDVRVKAGTYPTPVNGTGIANRLALVDYSTSPTLVRKANCDVASTEAAIYTTGAGGTFSATKLCFSPPSYMRVLAAASVGSAKYVKGQLDSVFHRDPEVGATVQGGLITYQMELANTGNVDFKNLQMVDVLPYDLPAPGNRGVRDLVALGTAWTPQLAGPVVISPTIAGLTVRYSTETNPCRPLLAPINPGCTPMVDGIAPGPGVWSLNLPSDPTTVRSLKFDFGPYVLPANQVVRFTFPMFAPANAPLAGPGPDNVPGNNDDTNVAWNTFAYQATRVDDNSVLVAQPPRVGIEVQPTPAGLASYGNYVWNDVNADGVQNEPPFRGINGVTVRLYSDSDGDIATTSDQTLVGVKITANDAGSNPGYYLFPALNPGNYFAEFVPPAGFVVTTPNSTVDTLDSDIDIVTFRSHVTALIAGQDYIDTDAGFYAPVVSLGNRLWYDTNNDGLDNDGAGAVPGSSTGISGATVQLFLDTNGDGQLTGAEQDWIAEQTTDASGFYTFAAQTHSGGAALGSPVPLYPAQYIVGLPAANFTGIGALVGYHSSGTTIDTAGAIIEQPAPDPDLGADGLPGTADDDLDRDDNGDTVRPTVLIPSPFYNGGVTSKPVFVDTNEPTGEPESPGSAPGPIPVADNASNLTLDFGFYTTSFGNLVWNDNGAGGGILANGLRDGGEPGIAGVKVYLYSGDNGTEIRVGPDGLLGTADDATGGMLTDSGGNYLFGNLPQGQYRVRVGIPAGFVSTRDTAGTSNPASNVDSDDNIVGTGTGTIATNAITLAPGAAGTLSNNTVSAATGSTFDPTVDFGLVRAYSLGNRVWHDTNNDGLRNGSEIGISGVSVRLYKGDGTTVAQYIDGSNVANVNTSGTGYYRFDNLPAGDYIVEIRNTNFTGAGALVGYRTSTGAASAYEPAPDPDDDTDNDDNGTFAAGVARSQIVTIGEGTGTAEPTTDTDGGAIASGEAPDNQSNRTVDFGFYAVFSLGNRVWNDANNNGVFDSGELGLDGRPVSLYRDSNGDGNPDGPAIDSMNTANGGYYLFTNLLADTYLVEVDTPAGYASSTGDFGTYEPAPDADINATDNDDNGSASGAVVRSAPVTLSLGAEPTGEPATPGLVDDARDNNGNYTVDFGFFQPLSLGNLVWEDLDNNGVVNGAEVGISGVAVRLYRDNNGDGTPDDLRAPAGVDTADAIRVMSTIGSGNYLFTGLGAGDYIVEVVTPAGMRTSTGQTLPLPYEPGPDADAVQADDDDNGTANGSVVRSAPVTLSVGGEPTGEPAIPALPDPSGDSESNLTVDFGFYQALSLGNLVWQDSDNSGTVNGAEIGIPGVPVRLYRDSDDNGIADDADGSGSVTSADAIASAVTNGTGHYLFTDLNASTYLVEVVPPAGFRTSTGLANAYEPAPDADTVQADDDDNGSASGALIASKPVTLSIGGEPTGEPATPGISDATADNRANYTVDFGLYQPLVLGNLVWEDANNSGTFDAGDTSLLGATVSLFKSDGTTQATDADGVAVASQTTLADGLYRFTNLAPGQYVVKVTAPAGFRSSSDLTTSANPNNDTDSDDNGVGTANIVASGLVTLSSNGEPPVGTDSDDTSGNLTVDFGFYLPLRLGNLVWEDIANNGVYDAGTDAPLAGASVSLLKSDGTTQATDVDGVAVSSQTTLADGLYLFTNLAPGQYVVQVTAPTGFRSSSDLATSADPNNDTDNDDNGIGTANTVASAIVTLTSRGEPPVGTDSDDTSGNLTVDFGFYLPLRLGNLVWEDITNNGVYDAATDTPLPGATVSLFKGDGTTAATDVDGVAVASQTTLANGLYLFTNLSPGQYIVKVTPPAGFRSSTDVATTTNPNGNADNDDNGEGVAANVASRAVTLSSRGEPDTAADSDDTSGNLTVDFGFYHLLVLGNLVWDDAANNGVYDAGTDAPLPGASVSLFKGDGTTLAVDVDGVAVASQTTLANGLYLFTNLSPGQYIVKVTAPVGFRSSADVASSANANNDTDNDDNGTGTANNAASSAVTLSSNGEPPVATDTDDTSGNLTVDFGFYHPLVLGNLVWEDANNSGTFDAGDTPLPGATVSLFKSDGTTQATDVDGVAVASQTTLADGLYRFTNLAPGQYVVKVTAPTGFRSSSDLATSANPNNDTDNDDNGVGTANAVASGLVTLSSGGEPPVGVDSDDTSGNLTVDFGFYLPLRLGNLVWEDAANNGVYDAGTDTPLPGATVSLYKSDGTTQATDIDGVAVASQTTLADGLYLFTNLAPGQYVVQVTAPTGFRSSSDLATSANPNNDTDNDDNGVGTANVVASGLVTLTSRGEPPVGTDTDDTSGNLTVDFGFYLPLRLGNLVWDDAANNGVYDAGTDTPLPGATVSLYKSDGTTAATDVDGVAVTSQTTLANGLYLFTNLTPGQYIVKVTPPAGFRSSTDVATTTNPNADVDNDDNGEGIASSVASRAVTLTSRGEPPVGTDSDDTSGNLTVDFGFFQPLVLGNLIWDDVANNGIFDGADAPLAGAVVSLFGSDGVTPAVDVDGTAVLSQTTLADGLYRFTNLAPGDYVVKVAAPTGYQSSDDIAGSLTPNNDTDNDDNGEGGTPTVASRAVTLTSHGEPPVATDSDDTSGNLTVDFGFFQQASLGDRVWLDINKNGVQDAGETGVSGVSITLYRPGTDGLAGTADDTAIFTTTTGVNGAYLFDNLGAGDYFVQFRLPPGFARSPLAGSADPALDSDADPTTGRTVVTTLVSAENDPTWDAGIYFTASLGNRVWFDRDANGVQDAGEVGIGGVLVTLFDGNGTQVTSTTTDAGGFYAFPTLPPGDYQLVFTPPAGHVFSPTGGSPDADADSNADPATGRTITTTIDPGESDPTWDAGLYIPVRLGNLVWEDANNNGLLDTGEQGIAGVAMRLYRDANGDNVPDSAAQLAGATTDASGHYLFDNLVPGMYLVEIVPPAGYATSTGRNGMAVGGYEAAPDPDTNVDDDDNGTRLSATIVRSASVLLLSGDEPTALVDTDDTSGNLTVDFGLFRPASLGSVVWYDRNGDGRHDPTEAGVPGVTITLYYTNGAPVTDALGRPIQIVTGPDGGFLFDNLIPGSYQVSVTGLPPGYTFTVPNRGSDDADSDVDPLTGMTAGVTVVAGQQVLTLYAGLINPTSIALVRFGAERTAAGVALSWETGAEFNTAGFRIYRSATSNAADALLVSDALIVARGDPQTGAIYRWNDTTAKEDVSYSYWLEEEEVGGGTTRFGPAKVAAKTAATTYSVFLPLVAR